MNKKTEKESWAFFIKKQVEKKISLIEERLKHFEEKHEFTTDTLNKVKTVLEDALTEADTDIKNLIINSQDIEKGLNEKEKEQRMPQRENLYLISLPHATAYLMIDFAQHHLYLLKGETGSIKEKKEIELSIVLEDFILDNLQKNEILMEKNLRTYFFIRGNELYDWNKAIAFPYSNANNTFILVIVPSSDQHRLGLFSVIDGELCFQTIHKLDDTGKINHLCFLRYIKPHKHKCGSSILVFTTSQTRVIEIFLQCESQFEIIDNFLYDSISNAQTFRVDNTENELVIISEWKHLFKYNLKLFLLKNKEILVIKAKLDINKNELIQRVIQVDDKYCAILSNKEDGKSSYLKFVIFDLETTHRIEKVSVDCRFLVLSTSPLILLLLTPEKECNQKNCYALHKVYINVNQNALIEKETINVIAQLSLSRLYYQNKELKWFSMQNDLKKYFNFIALQEAINFDKESIQDSAQCELAWLEDRNSELILESEQILSESSVNSKKKNMPEEIDGDIIKKKIKLT